MIVATWQKCIYCLKNELPSQQFNTWIRPLRFINGNNTLYLLAPNKFILEWVKDHFLERIKEIITDSKNSVQGLAHPNDIIEIPNNGHMTSLLSVIPLQLLAYELAISKNIDPDKPKNLAKAVTVD